MLGHIKHHKTEQKLTMDQKSRGLSGHPDSFSVASIVAGNVKAKSVKLGGTALAVRCEGPDVPQRAAINSITWARLCLKTILGGIFL